MCSRASFHLQQPGDRLHLKEGTLSHLEMATVWWTTAMGQVRRSSRDGPWAVFVIRAREALSSAVSEIERQLGYSSVNPAPIRTSSPILPLL